MDKPISKKMHVMDKMPELIVAEEIEGDYFLIKRETFLLSIKNLAEARTEIERLRAQRIELIGYFDKIRDTVKTVSVSLPDTIWAKIENALSAINETYNFLIGNQDG